MRPSNAIPYRSTSPERCLTFGERLYIRIFVCKRTGKPGTKMESPPFKGPVGAWLGEHVAQETWEDWIKQGTKVINELRLDFSRDEDQETYDRYMYEFLGLDDDKLAEIREAAS